MSDPIDTSEQAERATAKPSGIKVRIIDTDRVAVPRFDVSRDIAVQVLNQMDALPKITEVIQRELSGIVSAKFVAESSLHQSVKLWQSILEHEKQIVQMNVVPLIQARLTVEGLFKSLQPALESIRHSIATQQSGMVRALEPLRQFFLQEHETAAAFLYAGFCMAPSMSNALIQRVVALRRENKKKLMAQTIMRYYQNRRCARLQAMVAKWESNPLFAPRMQLLRDALQAHLEHRFTLAIPVLLMQAEGIAVDFLLHYKIPTRSLIKKQLFTDALNEITADRMRFAVHESVTEFIDTVLYANKSFETLPIKSKERINRHVILHGRQVNYATERNSLRMFLLLDALSALSVGLEEDERMAKRRHVGVRQNG